ncbi:MAG: NAD(+) diphosphatase [Pseudomonadota bacterium]
MAFIPMIIPSAPFTIARWFVFQGGRLLVHVESAEVPRLTDLAQLGLTAQRSVFLGTLYGEPSFVAEVDADSSPPAGLMWEGLRTLFTQYDAPLVAAASRAVQLIDWDRNHQFCGRCATRTQRREYEHSRECPRCGLVAYPRISPAMMALVKRGRQLLLARAANFPEGLFSALAGFVEAGESIEDTVIREVREEVGIEVSHLRYFGSQSWPFPNSLMIAFVCEYAGGEITPQAGEIAEAGWFDVDDLPRIPTRISIAGQLIRSVVEELR